MTKEFQVEQATRQDLDEILALLAQHGLPPDGLREHLATTLVARHAGRVVGSAALEVYEDGALLSVAVAPQLQGQGVGRRLTEAAIHLAEARRARAVYLLTTTAERYFPKFGFVATRRAAVPETVQTSIEFKSACPSSALVMRKEL
jgi:amino-acid N-acetyltransferase